jgi:hypothetical protein
MMLEVRYRIIGHILLARLKIIKESSKHHHKTISLIISPIISSELILRTIAVILEGIWLIVQTISPLWDPGG